MSEPKQYVRDNGFGFDVYRDQLCEECGKVHPIKVNEMLGSRDQTKRNAQADRLRGQGYFIISNFTQLDALTGKCEPSDEEDEDESDEEEGGAA